MVRHERAAVGVARPHVPVKVIEGVAQAVVAEMRDVEDDIQTLHFAQELAAGCSEAARRVGALRVHSRAVVRGSDGAQSAAVGALQVRERDERVGAFQAQHVANRRRVRVLVAAPALHMTVQVVHVRNLRAARRVPPSRRTRRADLASSPMPGRANASRAADCRARRSARSAWRHTSPPGRGACRETTPFRERGPACRVSPALARANLVGGTSQIPIPFQRVHRQIEVRVEDQHGFSPPPVREAE